MGSSGINPICPACNSDNVIFQDNYRAIHPAFAKMNRMVCSSCHLGFACPMPSIDALSAYNSSYFSEAHGGMAEHPISRAYFSGIAKIRIDHIRKYMEKHRIRINSVLEIGPGSGYLAKNWLSIWPDTRYFAIESDKTCHSELNRLGVSIVDNPSVIGIDDGLDLVIMSHVLEHLTEPALCLSSVLENLKHNGIIFIEVPCQDWRYKELDEPHLLFFNQDSMRSLLQHSGYDNIDISYHGKPFQQMKTRGPVENIVTRIRNRLIASGIVWPFAKMRPGMEMINDPVERAMVFPGHSHERVEEPATWLRAMATK